MATTTVNIHEARTHLSKLIEQVERGEEVVIARAGKPVARLAPLEQPAEAPKKRELGFMKKYGFKVPDNFNEMGRTEIEAMFYGDHE